MESGLVATGKRKQDVIVCDSSATVKVTLWEENTDILEQQASYCLQNFVVCESRITLSVKTTKIRNFWKVSSEPTPLAICNTSPVAHCKVVKCISFPC